MLMIFALISCGGGDNGGENPGENPGEEDKTITGITFSDATYTYDGTEKNITVSGTLPTGVSVSYSSAKATDAGVYNAVATLSGSGYKTLTLNAKLTINKAELSGISADENQSVAHDGEFHKPTYSGSVPSGVTVKYLFNNSESTNGVKDAGSYAVKIVFEGKNYNTLTLNVAYEITKSGIDLANLATKVINSFGSIPDVWELLPESLGIDSRLTTLKTPIDYSNFVNVSAIPTNGMGKQLNMVYGVLSKMETASSYVNIVYGAMNTVKNLYSAFLDENPEDYQSFSANAGPFTFSIELDDSEYRMFAAVGPVSIEIFSDTDTEAYGAVVHLTDTTVLKYTVDGENLTLAVNILNVSSTLIDFQRDKEGNTVGTVYEFLTVAGLDIVATSAMIYVDDDYTTIIGTKGDFIPTSDSRNCEIYDNTTGRLVGTEVKEDVSGTVYNTYWFPLASLNGVNTIKKIDEYNKLNPDTIYVNGKSTALKVANFGGLNPKTASRAFDIEFKTMYFFTYDEQSGEYTSVEMEIPMLFIQEEKYNSFTQDFKNKNDITVSLSVKSADLAAISHAYSDILPVYNAAKDSVTRAMIIEYCTGQKIEE